MAKYILDDNTYIVSNPTGIPDKSGRYIFHVYRLDDPEHVEAITDDVFYERYGDMLWVNRGRCTRPG